MLLITSNVVWKSERFDFKIRFPDLVFLFLFLKIRFLAILSRKDFGEYFLIFGL